MKEAPAIPDHTLLRLIGRGSYGEVWLARNVMGAGRAVKIVRRASFDSDRPYEREFAAVKRYEPASRLADGLVNVLHVGRSDAEGLFYYVMELADDAGGDEGDYAPRTLRAVLAPQPRLPPAECIAIAQTLAHALASLHRTGLTHRDIKPSNIIFVNGRAKLADIGLVGEVGESRSFVGTEGYIPPEGPGLPGADLYALGMVFYEMITGSPPAEYPRVPQEWMARRSAVEMEFVEVVLHATEPEAERRYQAAGELQADLALLESGKSVRRVHLLERRWRAVRRVAVLSAAALLLLGGGLWLWHQNRLRGERAGAAEQLAAQARADERRQRFLALRERAARLVRSESGGWRQPALHDIDEAAQITPDDIELRNTLITALSRADLTERARWSQPGGNTAGPALSDDGTLVAVAQEDGSFRILRAADGAEVQHVRHWLAQIQPYFECAFTADGRYFGVRFRGMRTLRPALDRDFLYESWTWFRVSDGRIALELPASFICDSAPSRDATRLMAVDTTARALVTFDLDTGRETARVPLGAAAGKIHTSPDGVLAAVQCGADMYCDELVVVETATGTEKARWKGLRYMSGAVAWTADSQRLLLGGSAAPRGVRLLRMDRPGVAPERIGMHSSEIVALDVSPDGRFLLTSSWDQTSLLTDLVLRRAVAVLPGYGHAGGLRFSPDGRRVQRRMIEGDRRTELVLSDFEAPIAALHAMPGQVYDVAWSPDGKWLAAGHDRGLTLTDTATGRSTQAQGVSGTVAHCAFAGTGDGLLCAAAIVEGLAMVARDGTAWTARNTQLSPGGNLNDFSTATATGRLVAWSGSGPSLAGDGSSFTEFLPARRHIVSGGVTADGRLAVYSRGGGNHLYLCDDTGRELAKVPADGEPWAGISPDGARISANCLRFLRCWDTATRTLLWEQEKDFPFIRGSPLHTPDGRWLIARTGLYPVVFDAATGERLAVLAPAFRAPTQSAALSPDGSRLALGAHGYVLVWEFSALLAELRRRGM